MRAPHQLVTVGAAQSSLIHGKVNAKLKYTKTSHVRYKNSRICIVRKVRIIDTDMPRKTTCFMSQVCTKFISKISPSELLIHSSHFPNNNNIYFKNYPILETLLLCQIVPLIILQVCILARRRAFNKVHPSLYLEQGLFTLLHINNDSEDDSHTGCRNIGLNQQTSFPGPHKPATINTSTANGYYESQN